MKALRSVLVALALLAPAAAAQRVTLPALPPVDSGTVVVLRLLDWREVSGRVVAEVDSTVTLLTDDGTQLRVPHEWIRAWRPQDARLTLLDPNASRLFFAPTGRTLPKRAGYFANYYLFVPGISYGLSDRLTVSGVVSVVPAADAQLAYLSPKFAIVRSPRFNFAMGALWITIPDVDQPGLGAGYGAATFGTTDNAVTVMAGYPFSTRHLKTKPIVMLGAERRLGGRSKGMAELWSVPGTDGVPLLVGLRWFSARLAIDFGVASVLGGRDITSKGLPVVPWLDFALHW
jgi:hypothetical protein